MTNFSDLQLSPRLLQAIGDLGFQTPSPIQQETIPGMLQKRDMIALAQTGTGKTAAFALPILENLLLETAAPQALVLAPTRELAIQVGEHFESLGKHMPGLKVTVICGGQDMQLWMLTYRLVWCAYGGGNARPNFRSFTTRNAKIRSFTDIDFR